MPATTRSPASQKTMNSRGAASPREITRAQARAKPATQCRRRTHPRRSRAGDRRRPIGRAWCRRRPARDARVGPMLDADPLAVSLLQRARTRSARDAPKDTEQVLHSAGPSHAQDQDGGPYAPNAPFTLSPSAVPPGVRHEARPSSTGWPTPWSRCRDSRNGCGVLPASSSSGRSEGLTSPDRGPRAGSARWRRVSAAARAGLTPSRASPSPASRGAGRRLPLAAGRRGLSLTGRSGRRSARGRRSGAVGVHGGVVVGAARGV
jgi:hypothetical protein